MQKLLIRNRLRSKWNFRHIKRKPKVPSYIHTNNKSTMITPDWIRWNDSREMSSLARLWIKKCQIQGIADAIFPNKSKQTRCISSLKSPEIYFAKKKKISNKSRKLINDYTPYINQWNAIIHPGPKLTNFLKLYHRLVLIYHIEQWLWLFYLTSNLIQSLLQRDHMTFWR